MGILVYIFFVPLYVVVADFLLVSVVQVLLIIRLLQHEHHLGRSINQVWMWVVMWLTFLFFYNIFNVSF